MLSISRFVHKCVCLCVCLSVCLFTFEVLFNGLFPPTSLSRISKLFRDSESLEKKNGKKRSQIWKLLIIKGVKLPRQKKVSLQFIFFIFFTPFNIFLPLFPKVQCPNTLDFQNPGGKSNGKKWSQIWKLVLIKGVKLLRNFFFYFLFFFIFFLWILPY